MFESQLIFGLYFSFALVAWRSLQNIERRLLSRGAAELRVGVHECFLVVHDGFATDELYPEAVGF